jgi:hypothetical protein
VLEALCKTLREDT